MMKEKCFGYGAECGRPVVGCRHVVYEEDGKDVCQEFPCCLFHGEECNGNDGFTYLFEDEADYMRWANINPPGIKCAVLGCGKDATMRHGARDNDPFCDRHGLECPVEPAGGRDDGTGVWREADWPQAT